VRRDAGGVRGVLGGLRLTSEIRLVASGDGGFSLTDPFDCHVYLVASAGEGALVDAGIGSSAGAIADAVDAAGFPLRYILLTHAHPDHAGGAAALRRRFPEARVLASTEVARWVADGDEEAISLPAGRRAGLYPGDYRFEPCPGVEAIEDGDSLAVGELELRALATPGHAAGHMAYLGAGACFCGDLVFYGGRISLEANWDCSLGDYARSVSRLAQAELEALLPGHHAISLHRGRRHLEAAARRFASGLVPPSVV